MKEEKVIIQDGYGTWFDGNFPNNGWGLGRSWMTENEPYHPDSISREVWWPTMPIHKTGNTLDLITKWDPRYFEKINETIEQSSVEIYSKILFEPGVFSAMIIPPKTISKWAFWLYAEEKGAIDQSEIDIVEKINIRDNTTLSFNTHIYYQKCLTQKAKKYQHIKNFTINPERLVRVSLVWEYRKYLKLYYDNKLVAVRNWLNGKEVKNINYPMGVIFSNGWSPQIDIYHKNIESVFKIKYFEYNGA